jgi:hypothetical protein
MLYRARSVHDGNVRRGRGRCGDRRRGSGADLFAGKHQRYAGRRYMRTAILVGLSFLAGCSYTVTDDAQVNDLADRLKILEGRQTAIESRANVQGEQIQTINRRILYNAGK